MLAEAEVAEMQQKCDSRATAEPHMGSPTPKQPAANRGSTKYDQKTPERKRRRVALAYTVYLNFDKATLKQPNTGHKLAVSQQASQLATPLRSPQRDQEETFPSHSRAKLPKEEPESKKARDSFSQA